MPRINFSSFDYYPDLLCSVGEHMGYRHLSAADKDRILPIFQLSRRGSAPDLTEVRQAIRDSAGDRPFILDLDSRIAPDPYEAQNPQNPAQEARRLAQERAAQASYNAELESLLDPTDGFANWRRTVATFPNAIPMLKFNDPDAEGLSILRQAALLARDGGSLAIRFREDDSESAADTIATLASVLDSIDQLLIILDCGQHRQRLDDRVEFLQRTMRGILAGLEIGQRSRVRAVCMSNSFTAPNNDLFATRTNLDWRIWRRAREGFPFAYGDYAATPRPAAHSSFIPRDWRATVVYPLAESWTIYRHPDAGDETGYVSGTQELLEREDFEPAPDTWGTNLIRRAAAGTAQDELSARFWYAAKVNIHIHRQIQHAATMVAEASDDDEL